MDDNRGSGKVAIVNLGAARKFFKAENPVGRRFRNNTEVIGVAADVLQRSFRDQNRPILYLSSLQDTPGWRDTTIQVRTARQPREVAANVRQAIRDTDSRVPVLEVTTFEDFAAGSMAQERLTAALSILFRRACAGAGLCRPRRPAFGSGIAADERDRHPHGAGSGSRRGHPQVLQETFLLVLIGIALGMPCAIGAARAAEGLLFGLSAADWVSMVFAAGSLIAVGMAAAWWLARRAARVDPMHGLRDE